MQRDYDLYANTSWRRAPFANESQYTNNLFLAMIDPRVPAGQSNDLLYMLHTVGVGDGQVLWHRRDEIANLIGQIRRRWRDEDLGNRRPPMRQMDRGLFIQTFGQYPPGFN